MLTKASTLVALLTLSFAGCIGMFPQDVVNPLNAPPHPMTARTPDSVEVFTAGPPTRPRVDVAVLVNNITTDPLGDLRRRAAALGCDGLVIDGSTNTCIVY